MALYDPTWIAHDDRAGPIRLPVTSPSLGQHEHVVAQRLEVVRDIVARDVSLVVELGHLLVGALGKVAAETARVPGRVAGDAAHLGAGVGAGILAAAGQVAPDHLVALEADGLGQARPLVVVLGPGVDRIGDLGDLPGQVGLDHRVLDDLVAAPLEPALLERRAERREIAAVLARFGRGGIGRRAGGDERRSLAGRAVAVDALDLDGRADLAVELGVAVDVLDEMAVDAVHPLFEVDVELVDGQARRASTRRGRTPLAASAAALRVR